MSGVMLAAPMKAVTLSIDCPDCDGSGNVSVPKGEPMWDEPCPTCNGKGQVYDPKVVTAVYWATGTGKEALDAIVAVADTVELEWHYSDGRRWRWLESVEWEMGSWEEE